MLCILLVQGSRMHEDDRRIARLQRCGQTAGVVVVAVAQNNGVKRGEANAKSRQVVEQHSSLPGVEEDPPWIVL